MKKYNYSMREKNILKNPKLLLLDSNKAFFKIFIIFFICGIIIISIAKVNEGLAVILIIVWIILMPVFWIISNLYHRHYFSKELGIKDIIKMYKIRLIIVIIIMIISIWYVITH